MYYIDSLPRKVYAFDFDMEKGTISKFVISQVYIPACVVYLPLHSRDFGQLLKGLPNYDRVFLSWQ